MTSSKAEVGKVDPDRRSQAGSWLAYALKGYDRSTCALNLGGGYSRADMAVWWRFEGV